MPRILDTSHRKTARGAMAVWACLLLFGCSRSQPPQDVVHTQATPSPVPAKTLAEMSPRETVELVHRLRVAGRWSKLSQCLLERQRRDVVELIQAVDELDYADQVLQASLVRHFGRAVAAKFGQPSAANLAGVFSPNLKTISEKIENERAVVTIQIADRVPLEKVSLVRCGVHWCIETDPPIKGLPNELHLLAAAITSVAELLDAKDLTPEQTHQTLQTRLAPMKRRLTRMFKQATPSPQ